MPSLDDLDFSNQVQALADKELLAGKSVQLKITLEPWRLNIERGDKTQLQ